MKRLLFAALLATGVVGGTTFAQQYSTEPNGEGIKFSCSGANTPVCRTEAPLGTNEVYIYPGETPTTIPSAQYDLQYVVTP